MKLLRLKGWGAEGVVKPVFEIAISKEVHPQQGCEIGKGPVPFGQKVKPSKEQHSD